MQLKFVLASLAITSALSAQSFSSGSNGADGALNVTTPGVVVFDPHSFSPALNPSGDNVFHFTSVHIAKGVTVKLTSQLLQGPVFWLVQGPVVIDGTIDVDGSDAGLVPSISGAGGYPGGAAKSPGYGPDKTFKLNQFLVPLVGGTGGAGGASLGGGAGGGSLLIASSASVTVNGSITANGGFSTGGMGGGGGAIRLVAPQIDGAGVVSAKGGQPEGADGFVRFEAFDNRFAGSLYTTPSAQGKPFGLFLPPDRPASARVLSVGSGVLPGTATADASPSSPATVIVEAHYIRPGTILQLEIPQADGQNQFVSTTPLEGTSGLSRATASFVLPPGGPRSLVQVVWKYRSSQLR